MAEQQRLKSGRIALPARIACLLLALACLGLIAWNGRLLQVELAYRALPTLDDEVDRATLARLNEELARLVRLDPTHGEARNTYASVLGRQRNLERAVTELQEALKIQNAQNSLFFLADMYERMGKRELAEDTMADCVVINPTHPRFNPARLRMLLNHVSALQQDLESRRLTDRAVFDDARRRFGEAARDWSVRAPHDANSYLFMGNFHVNQMQGSERQIYLLQAYRQFLLGLSGTEWMGLNPSLMIPASGARETITQILRYDYAKPYRDLP